MPKHFDLVDRLLASRSRGLIHRVHLKGDTNATADNAHVVTDIDQSCVNLLLGTLHHMWFLPRPVLNALLEASGPKRGQGLSSTNIWLAMNMTGKMLCLRSSTTKKDIGNLQEIDHMTTVTTMS